MGICAHHARKQFVGRPFSKPQRGDFDSFSASDTNAMLTHRTNGGASQIACCSRSDAQIGGPLAQHAKKVRLQWAEVADSPLLCMVILTLYMPVVNCLFLLIFKRLMSVFHVGFKFESSETTDESKNR